MKCINSSSRRLTLVSDDDMARVKLFLTLFLLVFCVFPLTVRLELMCEVANVKVENEDGRTQTFEMKKLDSSKGESCSLCAYPAVNNAPELTALKSSLILQISDKELSPDCGKYVIYITYLTITLTVRLKTLYVANAI